MGRIKVTKETGSSEKARFISFEGGDGAGKTTQIQLLNKKLLSVGIKTYLTRETGGSIGAEEIRGLIVEGEPDRWDSCTETLLHFAARRDHLIKAITPALEKGLWVLCDRFIDSTMAYQGYGHGVSESIINSLCQFVVGNVRPHITIILDIPVEINVNLLCFATAFNKFRFVSIGDAILLYLSLYECKKLLLSISHGLANHKILIFLQNLSISSNSFLLNSIFFLYSK